MDRAGPGKRASLKRAGGVVSSNPEKGFSVFFQSNDVRTTGRPFGKVEVGSRLTPKYPLRGLEGVPVLPGAPQDDAGLTRKFVKMNPPQAYMCSPS